MLKLDTSNRPQVMGIVNVTPDSFSDGGLADSPDEAFRLAQVMVADGVDILDVGGESTRPGAAEVTAQAEIERVVPVIRRLGELGRPISVDTSKPEVMTAAVNAGATMINDVRALTEPGALETAAQLAVPVCLMHMQGQPDTMQQAPTYRDVVSEVREFLAARIEACCKAGIPKDMICIDPGFGFGKTTRHNLQLLSRLESFQSLAVPVLVGLSRKSMIGEVTGKPVAARMAGSLSAAVLAACKGASIIRVHDVAETVDAIKIFKAVNRESL